MAISNGSGLRSTRLRMSAPSTLVHTVEAISAGLESLKAGRGVVGKVAVIVDRDLALAASVHA
jgi:hypothetical protein